MEGRGLVRKDVEDVSKSARRSSNSWNAGREKPKKWLKRLGERVRLWGKGFRKRPPNGRFCHHFRYRDFSCTISERPQFFAGNQHLLLHSYQRCPTGIPLSALGSGDTHLAVRPTETEMIASSTEPKAMPDAAEKRVPGTPAHGLNLPDSIRIKNRRKRFLDMHPEYFGSDLELAGVLLIRFQALTSRC